MRQAGHRVTGYFAFEQYLDVKIAGRIFENGWESVFERVAQPQVR